MENSELPAEISLNTLKDLVKRYDNYVPRDIQKLEEMRLRDIPETIVVRRKDGDPFLEKSEVTALVEWKLYALLNVIPPHAKPNADIVAAHRKHGTYRPNLSKLVASNNARDIRATTETAFSAWDRSSSDPVQSLTMLTKLKGIGPATASLLLSCYDSTRVPFFSDELYRYVRWEDAKNSGWDRKIGYTMKEYKDLFARTTELRERLEKASKETVSALDLEKAAYILGREAQGKPRSLKRKDEETDAASAPPSPKKRKKRTRPHISRKDL